MDSKNKACQEVVIVKKGRGCERAKRYRWMKRKREGRIRWITGEEAVLLFQHYDFILLEGGAGKVSARVVGALPRLALVAASGPAGDVEEAWSALQHRRPKRYEEITAMKLHAFD
jgi:hypothetical protein